MSDCSNPRFGVDAPCAGNDCLIILVDPWSRRQVSVFLLINRDSALSVDLLLAFHRGGSS